MRIHDPKNERSFANNSSFLSFIYSFILFFLFIRPFRIFSHSVLDDAEQYDRRVYSEEHFGAPAVNRLSYYRYLVSKACLKRKAKNERRRQEEGRGEYRRKEEKKGKQKGREERVIEKEERREERRREGNVKKATHEKAR